MNEAHVTEASLQEYAYDPDSCDPAVALHIQSCQQCLAAANNYRMLYNSTASLPDAFFCFDAEKLVLSKIENQWLGWIIAGIATVVVTGACYVFESYARYLLRNSGNVPVYIALALTVIILVLSILKMIKNFRQSCNLLTGRLSA